MAITNEQVLAAVSEYREANSRPCPARYLTEKFGDEALDIVNALKKAGTLIGKRGRTGGLVPADNIAAIDVTPKEDTSVADQFALLASKLAEDGEISADAANG